MGSVTVSIICTQQLVAGFFSELKLKKKNSFHCQLILFLASLCLSFHVEHLGCYQTFWWKDFNSPPDHSDEWKKNQYLHVLINDQPVSSFKIKEGISWTIFISIDSM